jgi:hypothetical protein
VLSVWRAIRLSLVAKKKSMHAIGNRAHGPVCTRLRSADQAAINAGGRRGLSSTELPVRNPHASAGGTRYFLI